jgi:hypothetical protein
MRLPFKRLLLGHTTAVAYLALFATLGDSGEQGARRPPPAEKARAICATAAP